MTPPTLPRRHFLRLAACSAVAASLGLPRSLFAASPRAFGASEDVRVAVIGLRIKGNQHADTLAKMAGVRLIALCDADTEILQAAAQRLKQGGVAVDTYQDFRRLLERSDLDAVVIATPNHTHTLITLWALQAGKDVYVEKPISHTMEESQVLLAAAKGTKRIIQAGTQRRSDPAVRDVAAALRAGEFGRIRHLRGLCYKKRPSIGWADTPATVPSTLDLDLFCGPAPLTIPTRTRFHYDWHWFWETGNGEIGNQGPHELDICRWLLGAQRPKRVLTVGGRFGERDNGQTPNTQFTWFDFAEAPVLFEVRGLPRTLESDAEDAYRGVRIGVVVECEAGSIVVNNASATVFDPAGQKVRRFDGDGGIKHLENFISAVRAQDPGLLHAPVAEAVVSADLVHFSNLAYRTGVEAGPDAIAAECRNYAPASELFSALQTHVQPYDRPQDAARVWRRGGWLEWDAARAAFTGSPQAEAANALQRRTYRSSWSLPILPPS